ncbi:hypothetical protein VIGAN_06180600 [Vigna angularis var. angularis]|uniref:Uncharacterized protein n=1 Tax=Vigna angularis var. angularis TaxID=157739 RepID=A0A0S3SCE4_PHAAN|nr:hypothetical protein VIGAN_06180600 [Vigna angularis var. angularis]
MRMRVVVVIALMVASCCMAMNKMSLVDNNMQEHSNGNNVEHQIPLNSYSDVTIHESPGKGGPGERTVSSHHDIPRKDFGQSGPGGNA